MKTIIYENQKNKMQILSKNSLKKIGVLACLTFAMISCSPTEQAPIRTDKFENLVAPCETIKFTDFETATNWFGDLTLGQATAGNTDTYKFKAWQLKTGQTNLQAITANAPILVQDLNNSNLTVNQSGFYEALINPMNTHVVDADYTATIIYIIEVYDNGLTKNCAKANSYRYSRSNKQRG